MAPEPAEEPQHLPDVGVLRDEAGYALDFRPGLLRCGRDEEELLLHLALSLHDLLLPGQGWTMVHGAGLVLDGQAWVFLGPSHVGKSTLAVEAWLQGLEVLGDDTLLLHPAEGAVEAVPKPLKVRLAEPAVPAHLADRLEPGTWALGVAYDDLALQVGRTAPGFAPVGRRYPLGGACLLARDEGRPGWRAAGADRLSLVRAVVEQSFAGPDQGLAVLGPFHELLRRGRVRTLAVGDGATASALAALRDGRLYKDAEVG